MATYRQPRIALTGAEKQLLRLMLGDGGVNIEGFALAARLALAGAARGLERKGLARAAYEEGGAVVDVRPTDFGRSYFAAYPSLRNPIPWGRVLQWAGVAACVLVAVLLAGRRLELL